MSLKFVGSLLAALLWSTAVCSAQDSPPRRATRVVAQDPGLVGTWELSNGPLQIPRDDADVWIDRVNLTIRTSDGDSLSAHTFDVRTVQTVRIDGVESVKDATSRCAVTDDRMVSCLPSYTGMQTGHWYLGRYTLNRGGLQFTDPVLDLRFELKRVAGG